jgi:hypothetical protein
MIKGYIKNLIKITQNMGNNLTENDAIHFAVWGFIKATHTGAFEEFLDHPIYTSHLDFQNHYVPAMAKYQIKELSGASRESIKETLFWLVHKKILERIPRATGVTAAGQKIFVGCDYGPRASFTTLWVPTILPKSPRIMDNWPDRQKPLTPFERVVDAAEDMLEAELVMNQIEGIALDRQQFNSMMEPVETGDLSLKEAVAQIMTR